jgi:hypothetical protein
LAKANQMDASSFSKRTHPYLHFLFFFCHHTIHPADSNFVENGEKKQKGLASIQKQAATNQHNTAAENHLPCF